MRKILFILILIPGCAPIEKGKTEAAPEREIFKWHTLIAATPTFTVTDPCGLSNSEQINIKVNFKVTLKRLAENWLQSRTSKSMICDLTEDGIVNFGDYAELVR